MSHTPGPWYVEGEGGVQMDGGRDAYQVVPVNGPRFVLRTFNSRVPKGEQFANALLAAASPALLEFAETVLAYSDDPVLVADAEAVVALAKKGGHHA